MGKIRGHHNSPGIYTKFTDIKYKLTSSKKAAFEPGVLKSKDDGSEPPSPPDIWLIGMKIPGTVYDKI